MLYSMELCVVCKINKYENMEGNSRLIDLRLVKKSDTKINENKKRVSLIL